jgi:hypothetical protein
VKFASLPDAVFDKIAKITGILPERYAQVCVSFEIALDLAQRMADSRLDFTNMEKQLILVAKAAQKAADSLSCLNKDAQRLLVDYLNNDEISDVFRSDEGWVWLNLDDCGSLLKGLRKAASELSTDCLRGQQVKTGGKGGRPPGSPNFILFFLIDRLLTVVEVECGGRLTFDRPTQGGSLVTVLDLLRPYAKDVIPAALPFRAIQDRVSKNRTSRKTPG